METGDLLHKLDEVYALIDRGKYITKKNKERWPGKLTYLALLSLFFR